MFGTLVISVVIQNVAKKKKKKKKKGTRVKVMTIHFEKKD